MRTWLRHARIYTQPQLLIIFLLGIISGLPFLLTLSTLSFWMAESGVSKTTIGLFMLVSLPYSLKFLWAPFIDHFTLPYITSHFGRRRSWALISQTGLFISLVLLAHCDPSQTIALTALSSFFVAFFAATQDIIIDVYRIEILKADAHGAGAALEAIGFRFGMLASGAGALYLAHTLSWRTAYLIMAAGILVGMIVFCLIAEPPQSRIVFLQPALHKTKKIRHWLNTLFIMPWIKLPAKRELGYLLLFIFCFKMGDTVLNAMCAPFLCDLGFSKIEFANVTKVFGITLMVVGGLIGGLMIHRLGILQSTIMCVGLQCISCLMFVIQSLVGYHLSVLVITVGVESLCSGMVSAIFIAYISNFCRQPYTASHFTLLYSFGSFCRVIISVFAGWLADHIEWTALFLSTGILTLPAIYILIRLAQFEEKKLLKHQEQKRKPRKLAG
ncbi:MAG: AmpG family muropeptide MFS transporter [Alphaproteobacteria bacterium]|nr:AmpG family muropeptide MFS transporter [Alphaproteobacteria bacterium]